MEVKATLRHLRISPRKVRLVANLIKGLSVKKAEEQLQFTNKAATSPLLKLLQSAIANAVNNNKLEKNSLKIKTILVNEGFTLKRWKPRAMGRANMIRKRSSHVTIVLEGKKKEVKSKKNSTKPAKSAKKEDKKGEDKKK